MIYVHDFTEDTTMSEDTTITEEVYVPDTSDISYSPASLEDDLKKMDRVYYDTDSVRQSIIDKLAPIAMKMYLTPDDVCDRETAAALDAKMNVINTLSNLLNDQDKAIKTKIDIKTRQRELIENGKQTEIFISALEQFTKEKIQNMAKKAQSTADADLAIRAGDEGMEISEAELRADPHDLT